MIDTITEQLRARGYRLTPQRLVILRILNDADGHLSPGEICRRAQQLLPGLTEPTVYRTLNFLTEQNQVIAAHIGSGQLVYELGGHNHHHLICRKCGHSHEVEHDSLEQLYQHFQLTTGYQIDSIHVTFFGLCPACQSGPTVTPSQD